MLAAVIAWLLFAIPAAAQSTPEGSAQAGDLRILQLWSDDDDRFLREWNQPTPPTLTTTTRATIGIPLYQFIIFGGCTPDASGNCHLTAVTSIADPGGGVYEEPFPHTVWDESPPDGAGLLSLSPNGIAIEFEPGDATGIYRVRLAVTDENADVTAVSVVELEVTASAVAMASWERR